MIERVIENWLDKASERSFQVPFCQLLVAKGFRVAHLSRHCPMELGKDVVAVDHDGTPCAFQLKKPAGRRLTLSEWRKHNSQLVDMVTLQLKHPSLPAGVSKHRSFFVVNGDIDEEVARAISELNEKWERSGQHYRLETITRGDMLRDAIDSGSALWPSELEDVRTLLEMHLADGSCSLDKFKLARLLELLLFSNTMKKPGKPLCSRLLSSAALLVSLACNPQTNKGNHVAEIEAWTIYLSYILAFGKKWNLASSWWHFEVEAALLTILGSLERLADECETRNSIAEGDIFVDLDVFQRARATQVAALLAVLFFWKQGTREQNTHEDTIRDFCDKYEHKIWLWGEAAVPQMLAYYWYLRATRATLESENFLEKMIKGICVANSGKQNGIQPLASPYYDFNDIIKRQFKVDGATLRESFTGGSFTIEALLHIFLRLNWQQRFRVLWPDATRIAFRRFVPKGRWQEFLWRARDGINEAVHPKLPQSWADLRSAAADSKSKGIPKVFREHPAVALLYLCVFPHRLTTSNVRWLDSAVECLEQLSASD